MRSMTWLRGQPACDPAPSRWAYRANRLWLSPAFRFSATVLAPAALSVFAAGWYIAQPTQQQILRDWSAEIRRTMEARPEFQIWQMQVTGASPDLTDAIHRRAGVSFPVSWFHLDTAAVHDRIAALDAVADVTVTVNLGGDLRVAVRERKPAVLWRDGDSLRILDRDGHRIAYIDRRTGRPDLPLVTGSGADAAVPEALDLIAAAAPFSARLRGLTRQGARRWDMVLDRGQVIKLPAEDPLPALQRVLAMHAALDLLDRDIPVVDMRDPARATVRLGEAAMEYLRVTRAFEKDLIRP